MGRPRIEGVERQPFPRGHARTIYLDVRNYSRDGAYERTRFRCVPTDRGEKERRRYRPEPRGSAQPLFGKLLGMAPFAAACATADKTTPPDAGVWLVDTALRVSAAVFPSRRPAGELFECESPKNQGEGTKDYLNHGLTYLSCDPL